ncbi:MAG: hypothetical protein IJU48_02645 [Synergistaceae bacterium]|nr:hypothetical protein [Synergistaceae bacterium]
MGKKPSSGINRSKGIKSSSRVQTKQSQTVQAGPINASDPNAMEKLRDMVIAGVMPTEITGDKEAQAKIYEAIDSVYPDYTGAMANYTVQRYGSRIEILYHGGDGTNPKDTGEFTTGGIGFTVRLPSGLKATEAEVNGVVKHTIENQLYLLEHGVMYRHEGFPTLSSNLKWGGREAFFTDAQKAQIDKEIYAHVQKLTGRPISQKAKELGTYDWVKTPKGWTRNTWLKPDGTDKRDDIDRERRAKGYSQ